jgi:hypothetical protein
VWSFDWCRRLSKVEGWIQDITFRYSHQGFCQPPVGFLLIAEGWQAHVGSAAICWKRKFPSLSNHSRDLTWSQAWVRNTQCQGTQDLVIRNNSPTQSYKNGNYPIFLSALDAKEITLTSVVSLRTLRVLSWCAACLEAKGMPKDPSDAMRVIPSLANWVNIPQNVYLG